MKSEKQSRRRMHAGTSLLLSVLILAACIFSACGDSDKGYEIKTDGEFDVKNGYEEGNPFYTYEHGIMIDEDVLSLSTYDLTGVLGYLYEAQFSSALSSLSHIGEVSPVSVSGVIYELRSRDDVLTALLSRYYTVTEALFSLSESDKASIKEGAVYTQLVAGWCTKAVDNLRVIRTLISSGYLSSMTRSDRKALFERDKEYQVFLCRYYYIPIGPLKEIANTVDFDVDCLEYLKDVDCSAYDYNYSSERAILNEEMFHKLDNKEIIGAGVKMFRAGWSSSSDVISSAEQERRRREIVVSELNSRSDAAEELTEAFIEKYAELVHLSPYVANDNEYYNIYYEKHAMRLMLDGRNYGTEDISGLFSEEQLETLYNLMSKDRIQLEFCNRHSDDHDLLYNLYFSLN